MFDLFWCETGVDLMEFHLLTELWKIMVFARRMYALMYGEILTGTCVYFLKGERIWAYVVKLKSWGWPAGSVSPGGCSPWTGD